MFITFEGADGTGKSTQIARLAEGLRSRSRDVVVTREPGGTALGETIRRILLDSRTRGLAPRAEMAMMFAARAQHITEIIRPNLAVGRIVLCDRFTDSTEAYQGFGRGLGSEIVLEMHRLVCENLQPNATVLLMFDDAQHSLKRAAARNAEATEDESRFEDEGVGFQLRVTDGYRAIAAREPQRVKVVDAAGAIEDVHKRVVKALRGILNCGD